MKLNLKMQTKDKLPSFADLNDWAIENQSDVFDAVRYLQPSTQYDLFLSLWNKAGRPTEDFESALFES